MPGRSRHRSMSRPLTVLGVSFVVAVACLGGVGASGAQAREVVIPPSTDAPPTADPTRTSTPTPDAGGAAVTFTSPRSTVYGEPIRLAVEVLDAAGEPAEGEVRFSTDDDLPLGGPVTLVDGVAEAVYGELVAAGGGPLDPPVGELRVRATFVPSSPGADSPHPASTDGDSTGAGSTDAGSPRLAESSIVIGIAPAPSSVGVALSTDSVVRPGTQVLATATVAHQPLADGVPAAAIGGTVEFFVDGVSAGSATVREGSTAGTGTAATIVTPTAEGVASIEAVYSGDAAWASSASPTRRLPVVAAPAPATVVRPAPGGSSSGVTTRPSPSAAAPVTTSPTPAPAVGSGVSAGSSPEPVPAIAVADEAGKPDRLLVITALLSIVLLAAASGTLIAIRLRRRA